jgi:hypothetical protein
MAQSLLESKHSSEELVIPSSLNFIAPTVVDGLIRVGPTNDGGYVIPEFLIEEADFLVSFGLDEDWSFDEHFKKLNPRIRIHAYDHTISERLLLRRLLGSIARTCLGKSSLKNVSRRFRLLKSYSAFFSNSGKHFQERVYSRPDLSYDTTLDKVFARANSERVFLKIDIEGSEYRIIDDILKFADRIVGMVIEFHDTEPLRSVFATSIRRLQADFEIVHLHANNCSGIGRDQLPEVLEITFIKKSRCQNDMKRTSLPIPLIDSPNNSSVDDYRMKFIF